MRITTYPLLTLQSPGLSIASTLTDNTTGALKIPHSLPAVDMSISRDITAGEAGYRCSTEIRLDVSVRASILLLSWKTWLYIQYSLWRSARVVKCSLFSFFNDWNELSRCNMSYAHLPQHTFDESQTQHFDEPPHVKLKKNGDCWSSVVAKMNKWRPSAEFTESEVS